MRTLNSELLRFDLAQKINIFTEAFNNCYSFTSDELDNLVNYNRQLSTKTFTELLSLVQQDNTVPRWSITHRTRMLPWEVNHWEFGLDVTFNGIVYFAWIRVREDLAKTIFKRFNLQ